MSEFDISTMSPEDYFEQALMGMSFPSDPSSRFSTVACPPLCKCSMCETVSKSTRSFATSSTSSTCTMDSLSDDDVTSSSSSDFDQIVFTKGVETSPEEPARIDLSAADPCSPRALLVPSRVLFNKRHEKLEAKLSLEHLDHESEIIDLEGMLERAKQRDRELAREKLRLEIEKDNLKLLLGEFECPSSRPNSFPWGKLDKVH